MQRGVRSGPGPPGTATSSAAERSLSRDGRRRQASEWNITRKLQNSTPCELKDETDALGSSPEGSDSLSLDCGTEPTEVIVSGNNVKSIRLKFQPRPPSAEATHYSASSNTSRRSMKPTEHEEQVCQPLEEAEKMISNPAYETTDTESMKSDPSETVTKSNGPQPMSLPTRRPSESDMAVNKGGLQRSASYGAPMGNWEAGTGRRTSAGMTRRTIDHGIYDILEIGSEALFKDRDYKVKQDVLSALEYFEKRKDEMYDLNRRIMHELQKVIKCNQELEDQIWKLEEQNKSILNDNSELRIEMDKYQNEKKMSEEQSVHQWREKVSLEEMFCEFKNSKQKEIDNLSKTLESKEVEIKQLKGIINESKKNTNNNDTKEMELQYLSDIRRLKEELKTCRVDRDNERQHRSQLSTELACLRQQMAAQQNELEKQMNRFLSLKKSFNELHCEKEKLSHLSRSRRNSVDGNASSTWPATGKLVAKREVNCIDIPPKGQLPPADGAKRLSGLPTPGNGRNVVAKMTKPGALPNIKIPPTDNRKTPESLPPV